MAGEQSLLELLAFHARTRPAAPALTYLDENGEESERYTFSELYHAVAGTVAFLKDHGIGGGAALLVFDPEPRFTLSFLACLATQTTAVPLPPTDPTRASIMCDHINHLISDTDAPHVLSAGRSCHLLRQNAIAGQVLEVPHGLSSNNPVASSERGQAVLLYTSGSTSAPKGVGINHEHLLYNAASCCSQWEIDATSKLISWMPNQHSFGLIYNVLLPLYSGAHLIAFAPASFVNNPKLWLRGVERYRATHGAAATFGYQLCCEQIEPSFQADLSSWKVGLISAEPIRRGVCENFMARFKHMGLGPNFFCALYGLSETGPITSMPIEQPCQYHHVAGDPPELALASVGAELPGTRIRVVDPDTGRVLQPGQVGEVWVNGPSLMSGYLNRPEENRLTFAELPGEQGRFFRTGDQGFLRDGLLTISGRLKEIILVRGKNIYPQDLEWMARLGHPQLEGAAAAAFAANHHDEEHSVTVVIEAPLDGSESDWREMANGVTRQVSRGLGVALFQVVLAAPGQIPKTASGKIRRDPCRTSFLEGGLTVLHKKITATTGLTGVDCQPDRVVHGLFAAALDLPIEEIEDDAPLSDYQLDSMTFVALAQAIEQYFEVSFSPATFFKCATLGDVVALLDGEG